MTKVVTSIALMQLVEKGLIGLDDDLSSLMPEMVAIPTYLRENQVQLKTCKVFQPN
jgi:methyl acetate hydrolase